MSEQAEKRSKSMLRVLVPDNVHPDAAALLREIPEFDVQTPGKLSQAQLLDAVADVDALLIRSGVQIDAAVLSAAPRLRVVARAGVGVDNVDLKSASAGAVAVCNTPSGNTESTAEHTFALLLALARRVPESHASVARGEWDRKRFAEATELSGKTLAVVGFGRIGRRVAELAQAFRMSVTAFDPYVDAATCSALNVERRDSVEDLLADADFVTLHTVLNDSTRHLIGTESLAKAKKGLRVINAARGALIDDVALAAALDSGQVAGAALDVYDVEPPKKDHPLIGRSNVVHTPHLAASTTEAQRAVAIEAAELIRDALLDNKFNNVVNREVMDQILATSAGQSN